jgi:glutamine cyclotransferase
MERKDNVSINKNRLTYDYNNGQITKGGNINFPKEFDQGWGITNTDNELIITDGSDKIFFLNESFNVLRNITVYGGNKFGPVYYKYINELEYVRDKIFANIWLTNNIAIINPLTGEIIKLIDFTLLTQYEKNLSTTIGDVLNGIAYDKYTDR